MIHCPVRKVRISVFPLHVTLLTLHGFLLFTLAGCGSGGRIAAVVNGQVITDQEVQARMSRLNPSYRAALGSDPRRLLEEMVTETLLIQEARRRGLDRDPEVQRLLREASRQVLMGRLIEVVRGGQDAQVTDEEVAQFYSLNQTSFVEPETFRASHLLIDSEEAAKKALTRLKGGEPFAKVAEELSLDSTRTKGGDIGTFTKGQLIPEFEAACEKLKPGELSGVVKSPLGFHVILLAERKPPRQKSLEEVQETIRPQLAAQRRQRGVEAFVQDLRAKAQVQIRESAAAPSPPPSSQASSQPPTP